MSILFLILIFILGAAVGSFTNVLIDRIPRGENFWSGRSHCDHCKRKLKWFELFPIISYLVQNGKCRTCHKKIPTRLFFVEVLTGFLFVATYLIYVAQKGSPNYSILPFYIPIISLLVAIFFIDFDLMIIPDPLLITLLIVTFIMHLIFSPALLLFNFLIGIASCAFFLLLFVVTRSRGIGFGDVKFSFAIGFLLGFPNALIAFYAAFLTGAAVSLILIILGKKKFHGGVIAFGPFLIIGIFVALYFSPEIIKFFPYL